MEIVKRDVDELNELAKKMTGVNPKANTTAQALNYIEQNYSGGGSSLVILKENEDDGTIDLTPEQYDGTKMYVLCNGRTYGDDIMNVGDVKYEYYVCSDVYIPVDDSGEGEYSITFRCMVNNSMRTYTSSLKSNKFKIEGGLPS